jgi:ribonucleoside-diphosphate reductase alpha chain/ribonucleoside-triphosphate reductase
VRVTATDPLVKVCEELGYPIFNEIGQTDENCTTKVIEFPVKCKAKRTKYDVSAIEQLEDYKMFMENYVEHNASITVTVKENEWEDVEQWVWDNWDTIVGVTFLSLDNHIYPLAPYEEISEEEYNRRKAVMKPFDASLLMKYEVEEAEVEDLVDDTCTSGACPVR